VIAVLKTLVGLIVGLGLLVGWVVGPYYFRVQHFEADIILGYHADFYVYISPGARKASQLGEKVVLLVQPNNSGTNSDEPAIHRKDAWLTGFGRHSLADELNVVLFVPAFVRPSVDWHIYTHALDRDVLTTDRSDLGRIDLQLLAMVATIKNDLQQSGMVVEDKFLIQGYSASGMFANRFTALHPDKVLAAASGSPGGWPIAPISSFKGQDLPYPAGISDLLDLTGAAFDSLGYAQVPQLIVMGALDENDSLDFTDGWEIEAAQRVDSLFGETPLERWAEIKEIYNKSGANASFLLVDGVGHDRKKLQVHSTEFFKSILARLPD